MFFLSYNVTLIYLMSKQNPCLDYNLCFFSSRRVAQNEKQGVVVDLKSLQDRTLCSKSRLTVFLSFGL